MHYSVCILLPSSPLLFTSPHSFLPFPFLSFPFLSSPLLLTSPYSFHPSSPPPHPTPQCGGNRRYGECVPPPRWGCGHPRAVEAYRTHLRADVEVVMMMVMVMMMMRERERENVNVKRQKINLFIGLYIFLLMKIHIIIHDYIYVTK